MTRGEAQGWPLETAEAARSQFEEDSAGGRVSVPWRWVTAERFEQ